MPRIVRAYYVGNLPVCYLFRHFGPTGKEYLYIQTPRVSHGVKTIEAGDALVAKLLQTDTPMVAGGQPMGGYRVAFKATAVKVLPTTDAAEFDENPARIGVKS